jgi:hypothetical protein
MIRGFPNLIVPGVALSLWDNIIAIPGIKVKFELGLSLLKTTGTLLDIKRG